MIEALAQIGFTSYLLDAVQADMKKGETFIGHAIYLSDEDLETLGVK
jgi:hypothetical protein